MTSGAETEGQPRFDPRHDPMFQRGFRAGEHDRGEHQQRSRAAERSRATDHGHSGEHSRATEVRPTPTSPNSPAPPGASASPNREKRLDSSRESSDYSRLGDRSAGGESRDGRDVTASMTATNGADAHTVSVSADDDEWATDARPRVNPFLATLWVLGFALIAGGIWLYWRAISNQSNGYSGEGEMPFDLLLQQVAWTLSSTMISTGFLVLVGLLFERAFRWQRERRASA